MERERVPTRLRAREGSLASVCGKSVRGHVARPGPVLLGSHVWPSGTGPGDAEGPAYTHPVPCPSLCWVPLQQPLSHSLRGPVPATCGAVFRTTQGPEAPRPRRSAPVLSKQPQKPRGASAQVLPSMRAVGGPGVRAAPARAPLGAPLLRLCALPWRAWGGPVPSALPTPLHPGHPCC